MADMEDPSLKPGVAEGEVEAATEPSVLVELADILYDPNWGTAAVVLRETAGNRVLPMYISGQHAVESVHRLREIHLRPTMYDVFAAALTHLEGELLEVRVHATQKLDPSEHGDDNVYLAMTRLKRGTQSWEIDARPSDAIMAALVLGAPIRAAEKVLERMDPGLPEALLGKLGQGIDQLVRLTRRSSRGAGASPDPRSAEEAREQHEQDKAVRELLNYIYYRSTEPPPVEKPVRAPWWAFWLRKKNSPAHEMGQYPIPYGGAAGTADLPAPSEAEREAT